MVYRSYALPCFDGTESGRSNRDESVRMQARVPGVLLRDHERY